MADKIINPLIPAKTVYVLDPSGRVQHVKVEDNIMGNTSMLMDDLGTLAVRPSWRDRGFVFYKDTCTPEEWAEWNRFCDAHKAKKVRKVWICPVHCDEEFDAQGTCKECGRERIEKARKFPYEWRSELSKMRLEGRDPSISQPYVATPRPKAEEVTREAQD